MKKILSLLIASGSVLPAMAQTTAPTPSYTKDKDLSRWVIDLNLMGGLSNQNYTTANYNANYLNDLNTNTGKLTYKNGMAYGADAQLGFFFGKNRHWGLGTGFMYMMEKGDAVLDQFHTEYQSTDYKGLTFRQLITGNNLKENLSITNMNIPLLLKYKNRFSKHWGFAAEAGALFNVQMSNAYTTHSTFDYEAIYKFVPNESGNSVAVYDNSPTPSNATDWLITKAEFLRNNPHGNIQDYFAAKRALGMNVGLNVPAGTNKGTVDYTTGSVGFIVRPSINYFLSDHVALDFGLFYMAQPFKNNASTGYRLTNGDGTGSSMLNDVTSGMNQSYGVNIGARFFLCTKHKPIATSSVDQNSPSACGLCDGSIVLHGLTPNKPVTIDYSLNGAKPTSYTAVVEKDGQVKVANLCAGAYTGVTAKISKSATGPQTINLVDPPVTVGSQTPTNPTAAGKCDGSMQMGGFAPGRLAILNYKLNGAAQAPYSAITAPDHTLTITGLCEGKYTEVVVSFDKCKGNASDFTLSTPAPVVPVTTTPETTTDQIPVSKWTQSDIATPILFDVNKIDIHAEGYTVIDEAVQVLKDNPDCYISVKGNADTTGPEAHNRTLSIERANVVKAALIKRGVRADQVRTEGDGSRIPVATNDTIEGRQENRRAVMTLRKIRK